MAMSLNDWPAWQHHLRERVARRGKERRPPKLESLSLRWGLNAVDPTPALAALLRLLERFEAQPKTSSAVIAELTVWRATLADGRASGELGIAALAWARAMPLLAQMLSAESWRGLLDDLVQLSTDAAALQPIDNPLAHQLLAVELPLTLAVLFPELAECTSLAPQARKLWAWGAEEATDGEGLLPAGHLPQTKALLACWTRVHALARALGEGEIDEDVQVQFEWLLRQSLRLARENGSFCWGPPEEEDASALVKGALAWVSDPQDHALAKWALPGGKGKPAAKKPGKKAVGKSALPDPFLHSEWSNSALLRGDWSSDAPRLAVAWHARQPRCELYAHGHVALAGEWSAHVALDGWQWRPEHEWEEVCWHTDEDVVYLELETKLTDGWTLQRQMLLAPRDQTLLLADTILGQTPAKIEYRGVLPLGGGVRFLPADETREGYLAARRAQALVLPLALPEWRTETGWGELAQVENGLERTQTHTGQRLYAPLWIDLNPSRLRKPCTWRQLTVAEQLAIQPRDVAVAFRAQVGADRFALYRSLAPKANRTFLGQNIVHEFFMGRFLANGGAEPLLEIE
jgi:hypothetical protein